MLLVLASFGVIYYCKVTALQIAQKYPNVNCSAVTTSYGTELEKYAFLEYERYYITEIGQYYFTGPLQCYCASLGTTGLGKIDMNTYSTVIDDTTYSAPLCE